MELEDITVVVTGGASGLESATCRRLVNQSANAAILDLDNETAKALEKALGRKACFCRVDVGNENSVKHASQKVHERFRGISALVNCAGIGGRVKTADVTDGDPVAFNRQTRINLLGVYHVILWVVSMMKKQPQSRRRKGTDNKRVVRCSVRRAGGPWCICLG